MLNNFTCILPSADFEKTTTDNDEKACKLPRGNLKELKGFWKMTISCLLICHCVCEQCICTDSPELPLLDDAICYTILFADLYEPRLENSNNVVCATIKASYQPAHTRSLIRAITSRLNIL